VLPLYNNYYTNEFGAVQNVKAVYFEGFSFLPDWFWAFNYHNNVINAGVQMSVCNSAHCYMLPNPVFPTALWEAVTCIILFALLWKFRTKFTKPGTLISFYMIINGIERFFIEKIRVNTTYNIFGIHPTQAELISLALILVGGMMYFYFKNRKPKSISIVE
jgi:prolipoprotein diacylglyceryltransferase